MSADRALSLHRAGRLTEAEATYQAVLAANPGDVAALHGLGVLRHQRGDHAAAVELLRLAVGRAPGAAEFHFNLGLALLKAGRADDAVAALGEAARLKPDWARPHYDMGNAHLAAGRQEEAVRAFRAALKRDPAFFEAETNLANALKAMGKREQAIAAYRRVLRRNPDLPEVHNNLGTALEADGDDDGAEAAFRAALRLRPEFSEALASLATLLIRREKFAEAVALAARGRVAFPQRIDFIDMHAAALRGAGDYDGAIAAYQDVLARDPKRYPARFALAETYRQKRQGEPAIQELRRLVEELPAMWQSHHDLGNALRDMGYFAEAEEKYRAALALREMPVIHKHLGQVLRDLQRLDEAMPHLERAEAMDPANQDTRYNLAVAHLTAGRLREGLEYYESRMSHFKVKQPPGRAWNGDALKGRTLFVVYEQGLGDTIQFVRYLPLLAERGGTIIFRVQPALARLCAGIPGVADIIAGADAVPKAYDVHCQLMSLPHLLRLHDPLPERVPYLHADGAKAAAWRERLAGLPGRKIGLVWAGNRGFTADHLRSIPLGQLCALGGVRGASLVSLQKGADALPDLPISDFTAELDDFADTAALIEALDLVISVDTAVAHLAGAMGRPVWMLNRFDSCWRWTHGTDTSIWYPTLRQFRQTTPGDWTGPLRAVADAL
jgi:tetratricopeptide (TPR) repeat protein